MLDCAASNGRAIVFASDLDNRGNDFPTRASFVPFLDQAIRYLSSAGSYGGEYLVGDAPATLPAVPGVVTSGARRVVLNVDPQESEVSRMSAADFQTSVTRLKDDATEGIRADVVEQESRQHLWQYLLAVAIAALAIEGVISGRMA